MAIDGTTRLIGIIGDPIAQVKAPATLNPILAARGLNAVLVPFHVAPADLDAFVAGARAVRNLDALVVTVPHKVAVLRYVDRPSPRVVRVGAANLIRREPDGAFAAEITDGLGFVGAARAAGFEPKGRTALVVGSGGAGSAIASARGCRFSTGPQMVAAQAAIMTDFLTAHIR